MHSRSVPIALLLTIGSAALLAQAPSKDLPPSAVAQLAASLAASSQHPRHVWRDSPPTNADGTVNGYVEIPRGERRKYEFDMRANARAIDRVISPKVGGYPVNYGFVPQTVSYDGDPFDILVLGPPLPGGTLVRGVIVGLLHMDDEKGADSKVVVSPLTPDGQPRYALTPDIRREIGDYFQRYKQGEPGKFSKVTGWGSVADGRQYIETTHAFFRQCRKPAGKACRIAD